MKDFKTLKRELLKDKEVKKHYQALDVEFKFAKNLIEKRLAKGLTQAELAKKLGTKQSAISRLESGRFNPTLGLLSKLARALGAKVCVSLN